jgi:two-component system, LytTR family, sensor kinase
MIKNKWFWFIQFFCWLFIAINALIHSPLHNGNMTDKTIYILAYLVIGFTCTYFYCSFVERENPDDITTLQFLLYPLVGSCLIGLFFTFIDYILGGFKIPTSFLYLLMSYLENIWLAIPCFFFYHLFRFTAIYQDRKQRTLIAENLLEISELENLKKQLNPHFLFNALNSIKALTLFDGKQARESIIQLSDLLRLSLNLGEQQRATLSEELKLAKNYLALEKLRFDNRLTYEFNIQADLDNVLIMPMSLNTMLENAVKHGIGQLKTGGNIIISAFTDKNLVTIVVENSGFYDPKPKSTQGGIGLENLQKRLALQFGDKASFTITNSNKMVISTIKMPF